MYHPSSFASLIAPEMGSLCWTGEGTTDSTRFRTRLVSGLSGVREALRLGGPGSRKVGAPTQKMFPKEEQPRQGEVVRTTSQNKPSLAQGGHTLRE